MEPVLARVALNHVIIDQLSLVWLPTVAVDVKEGRVVNIVFISGHFPTNTTARSRNLRIGSLFHRPIDMTGQRHFTIATIASEIKF